MSEVNAMLDGTLGAGSGCLALVMLMLVVAINAAADKKHRENAEWVKEIDNPVVQAQHGCNGCMGMLFWAGIAIAFFVILGGFATGGGG